MITNNEVVEYPQEEKYGAITNIQEDLHYR